jgi:hypothetical protein
MIMLGRLKYTQQKYQCLSPVLFRLRWLLKTLKCTNHQVFIHHIPGELIKAGGSEICSEIHKVIHSVLNKKELPQ